jgi:hypothetical protein
MHTFEDDITKDTAEITFEDLNLILLLANKLMPSRLAKCENFLIMGIASKGS